MNQFEFSQKQSHHSNAIAPDIYRYDLVTTSTRINLVIPPIRTEMRMAIAKITAVGDSDWTRVVGSMDGSGAGFGVIVV
jgi:hypothetical protein